MYATRPGIVSLFKQTEKKKKPTSTSTFPDMKVARDRDSGRPRRLSYRDGTGCIDNLAIN